LLNHYGCAAVIDSYINGVSNERRGQL
jgi:hypothetical protein